MRAEVPESDDAGSAGGVVGRTRILTAIVLLLAMVMVVLVAAQSIALQRKLGSARLHVSDNETWVIAQLEVDLLKTVSALHDAVMATPQAEAAPVADADWLHVVRQFDIYYSRVSTVTRQVEELSRESDRWRGWFQALSDLRAHRDEMAAMIDRVADPSRAELERIDRAFRQIMGPVRDFSVGALEILAEDTSAERMAYVSSFRLHLWLGSATGIVLSLLSLVTWLLMRQIEQRAATQEQLRQNLVRLLDAGPDAVIVTDRNYRILRLNAPACEIFRCDPDKKPGKDALELFFPTARRSRGKGHKHPLALAGVRRKPGRISFRDIAQDRQGRRFPVQVTRVPLHVPGSEKQIALFVRDISENQAAMRALRREKRRAEADAARNWRFLAVMSHEIRTPLHGIVSALDLVRGRALPADTGDLVQIAWGAAQVALSQADEVLEIGRIEHEMGAVDPAPFVPAEVIRELVDLVGPMARHGRTEIAIAIDPAASGFVMGMRGAFWHAVSNLLSNAVKFTRQGTVTIRLDRTAANPPELRLEVSDTGAGIAPEMQASIFRDHFTTGAASVPGMKGAGLGLGVFRRAVSMMGGDFGLTSRPGEGSRFWFTFPAEAAQPQSAPDEPITALAAGPAQDPDPDLRVLVVDDVRTNRVVMQGMLAALGIRADLAEDGETAVALARETRFDVVLMDIEMPGMGGRAAAHAIRAQGLPRGSRIIALTANAFFARESADAAAAFDDVLIKPVKLAELRARLLELHHAGDAPGTAPAAEAAAPVLDQLTIADLMVLDNTLGLHEMTGRLLAEAAGLTGALSGPGEPGLVSAVHRVAGAAAMLGAARLMALALEAERWLREHGRPPEGRFAEDWDEAIRATRAAYEALLDHEAPPQPAIFG